MFIPEFSKGEEIVVPRKTTKNRSGGLRFDIFGGSRYRNAAGHEFLCCFFLFGRWQ